MSIWHIVMLSAGAVAASTNANEAGPCSPEIYSMEARIEARLNAKAAAGSTAQESSEALLHRQPTPRSIAAAESRLGTVSPQKLDAITQGMARATRSRQRRRSVCLPASIIGRGTAIKLVDR